MGLTSLVLALRSSEGDVQPAVLCCAPHGIETEPSSLEDMLARKRERDLRKAAAAAALRRERMIARADQDAARRERDAAADQQAAALLEQQVTLLEQQGEALRRERLEALARLSVTPNREVAESAVQREVCLPAIIAAVARAYGVSKLDIVSARRTAKLTFPRQIVMYLAVAMTPMSYPAIGQKIGDRDHTTILYGERKITALVAKSEALRVSIEALRSEIVAGAVERAIRAGGMSAAHVLAVYGYSLAQERAAPPAPLALTDYRSHFKA
jgi:DnaA-like protein